MISVTSALVGHCPSSVDIDEMDHAATKSDQNWRERGKPENKATHITSIPRFWLLESISVMLDTLSKAVQSILVYTPNHRNVPANA